MKKIYVAVLMLGCLGGSLYAMEEHGLHISAQNGDLAAVQVLLDSGADVHAEVFSWPRDWLKPIHLAAINGHEDVVTLFLNSGAHVDDLVRGPSLYTTLHLAAKAGHKNVVAVLLKRGANPEARTRWCYKPANLTDDPEIKELLENATRAHR